MIVALTTKNNWTLIHKGIQESENDITDFCISGGKTFIDGINGYARLHPSILIIDLAYIADEGKDEAKKAIQSFRIFSEMTRILIIVPEAVKPGDPFVSSLVSMGIWDVIHNSKSDELPQKIKECIMNPIPYRVAVRWQQQGTNGVAPVREVIKTVTKTETIIHQIKNRVVVVANLTTRAGSTTISVNLARAISRAGVDIGLMELPFAKPYIFNLVNMEKIILDNYGGIETDQDIITGLFNSIPHEIDKDIEYLPRNIEYNKDGHITFYCADPRKARVDAEKWSYEKTLRQIQLASKSNVLIIDAGSLYQHESFRQYINQADSILVVIEPLVSECEGTQIKLFNDLKDKGYPVSYIYNRATQYSDIKHFNKYYGIEALEVPCINGAAVQRSINQGFYLVDIAKELMKPMESIASLVMPGERLSGKRTTFNHK